MAKYTVVKKGSVLTTKGNFEGDIIAYYNDNDRLGNMEQMDVDSGMIDVVYEQGDKKDVQAKHALLIPQKKEVWYDDKSGTWKVLETPPNRPLKIIDGVVSHNFNSPENQTVINAEAIKAE